jgi:hypothetical protein
MKKELVYYCEDCNINTPSLGVVGVKYIKDQGILVCENICKKDYDDFINLFCCWNCLASYHASGKHNVGQKTADKIVE